MQVVYWIHLGPFKFHIDSMYPYKYAGYLYVLGAIIKARMFDYKAPLFVGWCLSERCNYRCRYCRLGNDETIEELDTQQVFSIINRLKKSGTAAIAFWGGEPLLREDIGQIITFTHNKGIFIKITTNGSLLSERIRDIADVDIIAISFDGPRDVHDYQRQSGSYDDVLDAIEAAKKNNKRIILNTVITQRNAGSLDFILEFARRHKVKVAFQPLEQRELTYQDMQELAPSKEQFARVINRLVSEKKSGNRWIASSLAVLQHIAHWPDGRKTKCWAGRLHFRITVAGDVIPCNIINDAQYSRSLLKKDVDCKRIFKYFPDVFCEDACWAIHTIELNNLLSFNRHSAANVARLLLKK